MEPLQTSISDGDDKEQEEKEKTKTMAESMILETATPFIGFHPFSLHRVLFQQDLHEEMDRVTVAMMSGKLYRDDLRKMHLYGDREKEEIHLFHN